MRTAHIIPGAFLLIAAQSSYPQSPDPAPPEAKVIFQEDFESGDFLANGWRFFAVSGAQGTGEISAEAASEGSSGFTLTREGQVVGDTAFDRESSPVQIPAEATSLALVFDARRAPGCDVPTTLDAAAVAKGTALSAAGFVLGDGFQTFSLPVDPNGDPINLRFWLQAAGMAAQIDNIRLLDITAGNRLVNGDFAIWQNGAPVFWRAFSVNPGDASVERVDLSERGEKGAAALVRRNVFSWQDGGLDNWDTPAAVKFGETPVLKYECAMQDGGSNVGLSAAIVLIRQNGTATTLASETVMPGSDFSEMTLRAAGPVTEDGCSVVVAFRPWNVAQECAGVGGFLIRNVRLEFSKEN